MRLFRKRKNKTSPKIYIGRRSLCMGDDCKAPNMFSVTLSENSEDVLSGICKGLPSGSSWVCYLGKPDKSRSEEDGIVVCYSISEEVLIKINNNNRSGKPEIEVAENWFERMKAHPYIYCDRWLE